MEEVSINLAKNAPSRATCIIRNKFLPSDLFGIFGYVLNLTRDSEIAPI